MDKAFNCRSGLMLFKAAVAFAFLLVPDHITAQTFQEKYFKEGMYFFDGVEKIRQGELFTTYKAGFGLGDDDEMIPTNKVVEQDGKFTTKYELWHKGILVEGSMMNVIGDMGIAQYANGFLRTGLNVDKNNIVSEQVAIDAAIAQVGASSYAWEDDVREAALKEMMEDPNATAYPKPEWVITKKRGAAFEHTLSNYQLCYKVRIEAIEPAQTISMYINANDGSVFTEDTESYDDYTTSGKVRTWYDGQKNDIKTSTCNFCTQYNLKDKDKKATTRLEYQLAAIFDGNNEWALNDNENHNRTAASAHWYLGKAWDFYRYNKYRSGSNYTTKTIYLLTNAAVNGNAGYFPEISSIIDYIKLRPDNGMSAATFDVIAHEYTHAMIYESSALGTLGDFDARSLNEGYADIFGMRIEGYYNGYDWSFGEDLGLNNKRNFANPHADQSQRLTNNGNNYGGSAEKYYDPGYWSNANAHANAGVLRKWFYLLSNGGTFNGKTVQALGIDKAEDIAYITFNWWLWSNVNYPEAAKQTVYATIAHYGLCSNEHKQVIKALQAVGFSVPIAPSCGKWWLQGYRVLSPDRKLGEKPAKWTAEFGDTDDKDGTFTWHIPQGWNATATGNVLTLNSVQDYDSKIVSVTYTSSDNTTNTESMVVHFSEDEWTPVNSYDPMSPVNKAFNGHKLIPANAFIIYPNPANSHVAISMVHFENKATVEILDLTGRLIKTATLTEPYTNMDVSDLNNGIYLIKVTANGNSSTQKLSVIH